MQPPFRCLTQVLLFSVAVHCDLLGPRFPPPTDFTSNGSIIAAGWRNVSGVFDAYFDGRGNSTPKLLSQLETMSFSIGMFSIHDSVAQSLQYHHTSEEVRKGPGVDKVDGDSIYRLASVSKLITTFAGLLEFKTEDWDRPIIEFVPGLSPSSLEKIGHDLILNTKWDDVTLRSLAAQNSGIASDTQPWFQDLLGLPDPDTGVPISNPEYPFLPPIDPKDPAAIWPCYENPELLEKDFLAGCPPDLLFEGILGRPAAFQTFTTPAYSNSGFILLGLALMNVTGKPLTQVYSDAIYGPLCMKNSYADAPPKAKLSQGVIPGNDIKTWATPGGLSISSGGAFSSLNDLAKFATALMNSTLLPMNKTREWLKPVSHSADLTFSVGAPWEIYRYKHADTGAITDIYTKLGDAGVASSYVVLIPDYDAGFNLISASSNMAKKSILAPMIADIITSTMLPALEAQAAAEAASNFVGTYNSTTPGLNSSMAVYFNSTKASPGLYIKSWVVNGTDVVPYLPVIFGGTDVKLLPSIKQPEQVAFRTVNIQQKIPESTFLGPFLRMLSVNGDWTVVDRVTYGGIGLPLFVFDVGRDGKATFASPAATRTKLKRID